MATKVMAYRGICEHGKVRAMAIDDPAEPGEYATEIAKWMRRGLVLDRVTVEAARESDMKCEPCDEKWHGKKKQKVLEPDLFGGGA